MRQSSKREAKFWNAKSIVARPVGDRLALVRSQLFLRRLVVVAGCAGALRMLHLATNVRTLGEAQLYDAAFYHDWAKAILGRQTASGLDSEVPFANVGYPYFVAAAYAIIQSPTFVLVLQSLASAARSFIVGTLACQLSKRPLVGLIVAAMYGAYAPSMFFDGSS